MNLHKHLGAALGLLVLSACEETPSTPVQDNIFTDNFEANFDPGATSPVIPFPNNVLFVGADTAGGDYTLNIPYNPAASDASVFEALNDMDGFSTVAPFTTTFSSAIDTNSLVAGDTVRVFEVALDATGGTTGVPGSVLSIDRELPATEYTVSIPTVIVEVEGVSTETTVDSADGTELGANKLVITPLTPLKPRTSYLVAITNRVKGASGTPAVASQIYGFTKVTTPLTSTFPSPPTQLSDILYTALLTNADADGDGTIDAGETTAVLTSIGGLDQLRVLTNVNEAAVENYTVTSDTGSSITDLEKNDIVISWVFTTQSIGDVLSDVRSEVQSSVPASTLVDSNTDSPLGASDIFVGTLDVEYYLNTAANVNDALPLSGSWRTSADEPLTWYTAQTDDFPVGTTQSIPLMASIPVAAVSTKPAEGWPVVIFQHGITGNRAQMLAIADSMAQAGYAVVAIDLPLHGITGNTTDSSDVVVGYKTSIERTFDLDVINNSTGLPGADTNIDDSGQHFINLTSLLTTRDNNRQAVSDLFTLTKALEDMDVTSDGNGDFDLNNIRFVGHSLGAIIGTVFLALEPIVDDAVIAMGGGGVAKLLDGSATFGPIVSAGLALNSVTKGTSEYETFMSSAQTVVDSGDAVNYAADADDGRGLLFFEVIGNDDDQLPDQVVPNNVIGITGTVNAPLSGSDPVINLMGLTQQSASGTFADDDSDNIVVKYIAGHHGSILTPNNAAGEADTTSAAVTEEMQTEMATFIASDGASITITDTTVIDVPAE